MAIHVKPDDVVRELFRQQYSQLSTFELEGALQRITSKHQSLAANDDVVEMPPGFYIELEAIYVIVKELKRRRASNES